MTPNLAALVPDAPTLPAGNAAVGLANLLTGLGLKDEPTRDLIEDLIDQELAERGMNGTVTGVRYGVATVACDPHTAALLSFDTDNILAAVNPRLPAPLDRIRVTTRRRPAVHQPRPTSGDPA